MRAAAVRSRVILTGATGAVGSALLPELLDQDFIVYCIVRSSSGQSAEQRLRVVTGHSNAVAIAGDISKPLCGVDIANVLPIDKFVHAAADTSLMHASSTQTLTTNITGTANTLALAGALGRPEFHYIGTAYIAGDAPVLREHELGEPLLVGRARNPYEASKLEAERKVRRYRGPFTILRPSIVVGRSDDGSAPLLEGWYGFFKSVWRLREMLRRGKYFDEHGFRLFGTPTYKLQLPIKIQNAESTSINLIQLDWLSRTIACLIAQPARGRTYNLTHPKPVSIATLLRATFDALDLSSAVLLTEQDKPDWTSSPVKKAVARLINRELDRFRPYLEHSPQFETHKLYTDLGPNWPEPPEITASFIDLTMKAAKKNWVCELTNDDGRAASRLSKPIECDEAVGH